MANWPKTEEESLLVLILRNWQGATQLEVGDLFQDLHRYYQSALRISEKKA